MNSPDYRACLNNAQLRTMNLMAYPSAKAETSLEPANDGNGGASGTVMFIGWYIIWTPSHQQHINNTSHSQDSTAHSITNRAQPHLPLDKPTIPMKRKRASAKQLLYQLPVQQYHQAVPMAVAAQNRKSLTAHAEQIITVNSTAVLHKRGYYIKQSVCMRCSDGCQA